MKKDKLYYVRVKRLVPKSGFNPSTPPGTIGKSIPNNIEEEVLYILIDKNYIKKLIEHIKKLTVINKYEKKYEPKVTAIWDSYTIPEDFTLRNYKSTYIYEGAADVIITLSGYDAKYIHDAEIYKSATQKKI